jgi:predicted restriction endonuclease
MRVAARATQSRETDAYRRRCAVTAERTLPVLDAAHTKPYAVSGEHRLENGLLLRKDLHALFDVGYVTVTAGLELRVSRRIREEFENGRDYYALDRREVRLPMPPNPPPSREYLEWHGDTVFRA